MGDLPTAKQLNPSDITAQGQESYQEYQESEGYTVFFKI